MGEMSKLHLLKEFLWVVLNFSCFHGGQEGSTCIKVKITTVTIITVFMVKFFAKFTYDFFFLAITCLFIKDNKRM